MGLHLKQASTRAAAVVWQTNWTVIRHKLVTSTSTVPGLLGKVGGRRSSVGTKLNVTILPVGTETIQIVTILPVGTYTIHIVTMVMGLHTSHVSFFHSTKPVSKVQLR